MPTKGQQTRQEIIEKAAPLFNQRGVAGCSIADVLEVTGLEKGGLYRHFSGKEELAAEAFRYALAQSVRLRTVTPGPGISALEAIHAHINRFVITTSTVPGGCALLNSAVEHDDGNLVLRALVRDGLQDWRKRLCTLVRQAKRDGDIRKSAKPEWLADTIIATLEGAQMLSRMQRSRDALQHAQRSLRIVLDSVKS